MPNLTTRGFGVVAGVGGFGVALVVLVVLVVLGFSGFAGFGVLAFWVPYLLLSLYFTEYS